MNVGIDDMSFYVPSQYLPIETLAKERNIEYLKLFKGLGLEKMGFPDSNEDAATMAAMAIYQLLTQNDLSPQSIGRIYMGTESAVDGAKPTASYAVEMVAQRFPEGSFNRCDVVDLTFACIGGVDALLNTLDWVRADSKRIGIVVASDFAKYELESAGEYTQGAGAVALLVKANPRLVALDSTIGTSMQSVFDFFKPTRSFKQSDVVNDALNLYGKTALDTELEERLEKEGSGIFSTREVSIEQHKETPVFDGQYSNQCYLDRTVEALAHFKEQKENRDIMKDWNHLIFHLPYAAHGRRIFTSMFINEYLNKDKIEILESIVGFPYEQDKIKFEKIISKSDLYQNFIQQKINSGSKASSQIGNLYTASIFMSLMSTLQTSFDNGNPLENQTIGFLSYGSGSKSKVFEGTISNQWKEVVKNWQLFDKLNARTSIDFKTYKDIHQKKRAEPLNNSSNRTYLQSIDVNGNAIGARRYSWYH